MADIVEKVTKTDNGFEISLKGGNSIVMNVGENSAAYDILSSLSKASESTDLTSLSIKHSNGTIQVEFDQGSGNKMKSFDVRFDKSGTVSMRMDTDFGTFNEKYSTKDEQKFVTLSGYMKSWIKDKLNVDIGQTTKSRKGEHQPSYA